MTPDGPLLVIDTATTRAVVALGAADGTLLEARSWVAGYRHGEELLAQIERLLADRDVVPATLGGIVVGTGPGAFTGLRVGLATAKGLAHAFGTPIVGISTAEALLAAAPDAEVLVQPAGPSDRVLTRRGEGPRILPGGMEPDLRDGERLLAVDLAGRADDAAVARGDAAHAGLAASLLAAGGTRLASGHADDLANLVPEYTTLPRGVRERLPDDAVEVTGGTP